MPVAVQIILVLAAIAGLTYTVGKALSSVQKEDLDKLDANRKEDTARLSADIKDVKADVKELNAKFDRYLFRKLDKTDDSSE